MVLILNSNYFDRIYQSSDDPWSFAFRWYETRKYSVIMACLPESRYRRAFEPGCSIGVLTTHLAERCDSVLSIDISEKAVRLARGVLPEHVSVRTLAIPEYWPEGSFDLVVLSDVCHYFDPAGLRDVFSRSRESLIPGGTLIAAHWRHHVPDYPSDGDAVHAELAKTSGLARTVEHLEDDFRLEVYIRLGDGCDHRALSVAAREGWLGT